MTRMNYLDRFFDPERFAKPVEAAPAQAEQAPPAMAAAESLPPTVEAMEPRPNPPVAPPAERLPQPAPLAAATPAAEPADAELSLRYAVRQHRWLTRFWTELTPAQQRRVERQFRRGDGLPPGEPADPAGRWDSMGLADRVALVLGGAPPSRPPAGTEPDEQPSAPAMTAGHEAAPR
jgi:hypothetical protein